MSDLPGINAPHARFQNQRAATEALKALVNLIDFAMRRDGQKIDFEVR